MKYPYTYYKTKISNHMFWVAKSLVLNGCIGQGETKEEALIELEENEKEWVATAEEYGIKIPHV